MFIAVFTTIYFDGIRAQKIQNSYQESELEIQGYILETQLYKNYNRDPCPVLEEGILRIRKGVEDLGLDMTIYRGQSQLSKEVFDTLKQKYTQAQLNLWQLLRQYNNQCDSQKKVIIFFFAIEDQASISQSFILQKYSREHSNTIILSFDTEYKQEPTLQLVKSQLNATGTGVYVNKTFYRLPLFYEELVKVTR